ncbi:MAG: hypothetical protein ACPKOI_00485 [Pleomorphochaeta sp.]
MISFEELQKTPNSPAKAYILGVLSTRITLSQLKNDKRLLISGSISHNSQATPNNYTDKISSHFLDFNKLCIKYNFPIKGLMVDNNKISSFTQTNNFKNKRTSGKLGFSIYFLIPEHLKGLPKSQIISKIRILIINMIEEIPEEYAKYFIAAMIDAKGSKDTSRGYISLDVDSNEDIRIAIENIISKSGIININDYQWNLRDPNKHKTIKKDQLRFKKHIIFKILKEIPLLSILRKEIFEG